MRSPAPRDRSSSRTTWSRSSSTGTAPSSTPSAACGASFLAARDGRQELLDRHLAAAGAPALLFASLAVPGPEKAPPGTSEIFAWARRELDRAFPGAATLHASTDALGPFALVALAQGPQVAKARCVAIEVQHPAARLLDLDVYAPGLGAVDRAALGLPPRACLCCAAPARECIRCRRHEPADVVAAALALAARFPLDRLSAALVRGLREELELTPKPGLVDRDDCGSHPDLSFASMERSIEEVGAALAGLAASVAAGEPLSAHVELGRRAEARMLARFGANTHKGALFLGGVLLVARGRAGTDDEAAWRREIAAVAAELREQAPPRQTHGDAVRGRFGVAGILGEAAAGLPSLFDVALPALRAADELGLAGDAARFLALAALMQRVEDTTALHRAGAAGLALLRADGAELAARVVAGDHLPFLRARNAAYRARNLTMGGVADLLGIALGWLAYHRTG